MFEHFLITRFNLKLESHFSKDKNGNDTHTETWLNRRFELFDSYCFPSIQRQVCQSFKWLVLFDKSTPASFINQIEAYREKYHNFYPFYLETGEKENVRKCLVNAINSLSQSKTPYILTTRIDNDDAFHKDFIREIQTYYKKNHVECFLNFNYGLQYDLRKSIAGKIRYMNNHFISRLENHDQNLETVLFHDHSQIQDCSNVISIENKRTPMWIEVIHEMNVSNYLHLFNPIFVERKLSDFGLSLDVNKINAILHWFKFVKKCVYISLERLFMRMGLYDQFKLIIKFCKLPILQ